jgi:hypothetical protein
LRMIARVSLERSWEFQGAASPSWHSRAFLGTGSTLATVAHLNEDRQFCQHDGMAM